jgi:asparagine synthase (glutamine-hydrolysing)
MLAEEWRARAECVVGDEVVMSMPPDSASWDPLSRAQWLEMSTLLPGYLLASQGDRMLMGNSVEGRFPFLDRDLVQFANRLPAHQKLFGLDEKHLLKRAFEDLVPRSILTRPKQPYRAPDAASFFSRSTPEWVRELTSREALADAGVFDPDRVSRLVAKCARTGGENLGNTDSMRVLAVLSTQLAHEQFIRGAGAGSSPTRMPEPHVAIDLVEADRSRT